MMTRVPRFSENRNGVTLLHLLIAAFFLFTFAFLAYVVIPNCMGRQGGGPNITRESVLNVEKAAELYAEDHGDKYPPSLGTLFEPEFVGGELKEPYLERVPRDKWGSPILYEYSPGDLKPRITSFGPDKKEGGGDDITNLDDLYNNQQSLGHISNPCAPDRGWE